MLLKDVIKKVLETSGRDQILFGIIQANGESSYCTDFLIENNDGKRAMEFSDEFSKILFFSETGELLLIGNWYEEVTTFNNLFVFGNNLEVAVWKLQPVHF